MNGWMRWLLKREWLAIVVAVVIFMRIPTLLEPYWYGDEGIYLTIGQSIRGGAELYQDIHDNKPPFIYLIAAIADGKMFSYRAIAAVWNIAAVVMFALLAKKVFPKRKAAYVIAAWVFAILTNIPLLEGNIANAENFFLLPCVTAAYLLFNIPIANWRRRVVGAGLLIGLAALFKIPAVLEAGVWPLLWLATNERERVKKIAFFSCGVLLPIIGSGIYFSVNGVLGPYLIAAGLQNVPYLSAWASGIGEVINFKVRVACSIVAVGLIWGIASRMGRNLTWIALWGVIVMFAALLSGRPYPHYLIQATPLIALGIGLLFERRVGEKRGGAIIVGLIIFIYFLFSFWRYPVLGYYVNYLSWVSGTKSMQNYYNWFNPQVNVNYEVAKNIIANTKKDDKVFIWGDEPAIYALAKRSPVGKYAAKYHIRDFGAQEETMRLLDQKPPKVVVSLGRESELPGFQSFLDENYVATSKLGNATIYYLGKIEL